MKILYVCNEVTKRNGWGVINFHTIKGAIESGHEVHVLTEVDAPSLIIAGVKYYPMLFDIGGIRQNPMQFIKSFFKLRNLLKSENYDVVHILVEPYLLYFSILNHPNIVLSLVGTYAISIFKDSALSTLYKRALAKVHRLLAISDYTAAYFRKNVTDAYPIFVVPLGVDMGVFNFRYDPNHMKKQWFTLVGQLKERKGVKVAIKAIANLKERYPEIKLHIIGADNGNYAKSCKALVEELGVSGQVEFTGALSQASLVDFYHNSIGNVLPSVNAEDGSFEGFGLIHLEANACSILTIGSKDCGNESAIKEGISGFLAEQNDDKSLSQCMEKIIKIHIDGDYEQYAHKCYQYAVQNSWDNYFKTVCNQY